MERRERPRVVRQVESRSEADFEDAPFCRREQKLPLALEAFGAQYPIHESRENKGRIHESESAQVNRTLHDTSPGDKHSIRAVHLTAADRIREAASLLLRPTYARVVRSVRTANRRTMLSVAP